PESITPRWNCLNSRAHHGRPGPKEPLHSSPDSRPGPHRRTGTTGSVSPRLPALVGRSTRYRDPAGAGLSCRPATGRLSWRRCILCAERVPHHEPAGRRMAAAVLDQPETLLPAAGVTLAAGVPDLARALRPFQPAAAVRGDDGRNSRSCGGRVL